jgi:hypothetical protein
MVEQSEDGKRATELFKKVALILRGERPQVQGAVIAQALATFMHGHRVIGDRKATENVQIEQFWLIIHSAIELCLLDNDLDPELRPQEHAH